MGDGQDERTHLGPVINKDQYERIIDFIDDAKKQGARIVTGKNRNIEGFKKVIICTFD